MYAALRYSYSRKPTVNSTYSYELCSGAGRARLLEQREHTLELGQRAVDAAARLGSVRVGLG